MQHERLYLADIVDAANKIDRYIASHDDSTFIADDQAQSAVAFQLSITGGAVRSLPDELKQRYPEVAWQDARSMRNIISHQYFAIDWQTIWDTAVRDIPTLRQQIVAIQIAEFPDT